MKRILQTTTLVLAAAALLAPGALADRPDDRAGRLGVGGATSMSGSIRPDDRADARGPGGLAVVQSGIRPDDRAAVRGPGAIPTVFATAGPSADGFDWADAGIGAVGALGLALLLFGALQVASRRSHVTA